METLNFEMVQLHKQHLGRYRFPWGFFLGMLLLVLLGAGSIYFDSKNASPDPYNMIESLRMQIRYQDQVIRYQQEDLLKWKDYQERMRRIWGVDTTKMVMFKKGQRL